MNQRPAEAVAELSEWRNERVLIWGKTYPELSSRHSETVCTAGVCQDGTPIRLYPVSFRYLTPEQQYSLYDIVQLRVKRNLGDPRPESHKIDVRSVRVVGHIESDKDGWAGRSEWINRRHEHWHCDSVAEVLRRQAEGFHSFAFVRVGEVVRCYLQPRSRQDREKFELKRSALESQGSLFAEKLHRLDFIPNEVRMEWRCAAGCSKCATSPHDMSVLDWGLIQLGRKHGWEAAAEKLRQISNAQVHDFRVFLGNFFRHQGTFSIIALWYPMESDQLKLL